MTDSITLETRFDEQGHPEVWRNEVARELNIILIVAASDKAQGATFFPAAVQSIVARVAQFEEIQLKPSKKAPMGLRSPNLASQWESMQSANASLSPDHRKRIELPDGNPLAIRLILDPTTSKPLTHKDGSLQYCAPWSLQ